MPPAGAGEILEKSPLGNVGGVHHLAHGVGRETGNAALLRQLGDFHAGMGHGPLKQQWFQRVPIPGPIQGCGKYLQIGPVGVAGSFHQATPVAVKDRHDHHVAIFARHIDVRHQRETRGRPRFGLMVSGVRQFVGHDRGHALLQAEVNFATRAVKLAPQQRGHAGRRALNPGHELSQRSVGREWRLICRVMDTVGNPRCGEGQPTGRHARQLVAQVIAVWARKAERRDRGDYYPRV